MFPHIKFFSIIIYIDNLILPSSAFLMGLNIKTFKFKKQINKLLGKTMSNSDVVMYFSLYILSFF